MADDTSFETPQTMNLKREFNRIEHLLDSSLEKTRKETGHWVDESVKRANQAARRARHTADAGASAAVDYERAIARHARNNSTLYLVGGVLLIGLILVKVVREIRHSREFETLPLL
jgi:hypothetical protein